MNKLKKYLKILIIIFILTLISIITPHIVSAYEDGDVTVVEKATNATNTGESFVSSFNDLSGANGNTWYLLCNEHGATLRNVRTLYTLVSTNDATPEEAYILSNLEVYNQKPYYNKTAGQNAWWNRGSFTTSNTEDTLFIQDLEGNFNLTLADQTLLINLIKSGTITNEDASKEAMQNLSMCSNLQQQKVYFEARVRTLNERLAGIREEIAALEELENSNGENSSYQYQIEELEYRALDYERQIQEHMIRISELDSEMNRLIDSLYEGLLIMYARINEGQTNGATLTAEAVAFAEYVTSPGIYRGTRSYTVEGLTVNAPDLEMNTQLIDDDATISFSETDNAYIIGPFKIIYPEYGFTRSDGTYVMFSGLDETDLTLETNLGVMEYETDWKISYTSSDAADINGLPKSSSSENREFYIVLNYKPGMTEFRKLEFTLKYMNAGGVWKNYSGSMSKCTYCGAYNDYDASHCKNGCGYWDHSGCNHSEENYSCNPVWKYYSLTTGIHCQNFAILCHAVRWYTYQKVTWDGIIPVFSSITVNKEVVDEDGERVNVNNTFYFDIYVDYHDGQGEQLFETLSVSTKNGTGSKTSSRIYWVNGVAPSYRVEERDRDGYSIDGPWSGTLPANRTITISAVNVAEPNKGRIEIDKKLINSTPALESEIFTFKIYVWGTFKYDGGNLQTYTSSNPLELTGTITGAGVWVSGIFEWYEDSAPKYRISEIIPDGAEYELVSSNNRIGTLITNASTIPNSEIVNTPVSFINEPTPRHTILHVDKKLFDGSEPKPGEEFKVIVTIKGDFTYNGTSYTSGGDGLTIEITLNQSNNWNWDSEEITWKTTTAPQYTIVENNMPDNYEFSSTTDQIGSSTSNNFSSNLQAENTYVTIYNKEKHENEGKIRVIKLSETDDLEGKTYSFRITVTGNFTYNGTEYTTDNPLVINDTVNAVLSADQATIENDTLKEYGTFTWYEGEDAPEYTVEEINIPEDSSFVSISNNTKTVTNKPSITDKLSDDTVVIKMVNRGVTPKTTQLQIVKETIGNTDYLDGLSDSEKTFTFTVEITGTFKYTAPDGTVTNVNNDTLRLDASVIGKGETSLGNNIWISGVIEWNDDVTAPTYRVTEINIPEYAEFVSWSNRTTTVQTTFISGSLIEGQTNVLTAINDIEEEPQYGRIQISKKAQTANISGQSFNFTLTVTGNFTYNGTEYTTETPYTTTVSVVADGESWTSDVFSWEESVEAPKYTVEENLTEEQIDNGIEIVSISNSTGNIKGSSDEATPSILEVTAINRRKPIPEQGRIQITKEYVDASGNEIDGVKFQFEVTITYADGTTEVIPVEIESGTTWRSSYFYWESTEDAPTYQIRETSTGSWRCTINPSSGSLEDDEIIKVTAINTDTTHYSGRISITKIVEDLDKVAVSDYKGTFTFNVSVNGTFSYTDSNGTTRNFVNDTMSLKVIININGTTSASWTSGTFTWTGDAPTYAVEEVNIPTGWWLYSMSGSSGRLTNGGIAQVTCTNQTGPENAYILTMEMGGKVWDDTDYSHEKEADKLENGLIDEGEAGVEGVRVTITRIVSSGGNVVAELDTVYAYDENDNLTRIPNYTYTDSDGNWSFGSISVPAFDLENGAEKSYYDSGYDISYNVTFRYDGQTYEPTTFLTTSNGNASPYRSASKQGRDAWLKDSMAIDDSGERNSFNSKFSSIEGYSPMNADGDTVGRTGSGVILNYTSTDSVSILNSDNTRKISTLQTYDENGDIYPDFLIDASTLNGGLSYPFDNEYHLENWYKEVSPLTGLTKTTYEFSATYNYLLSINLGLLKREAADVATEKDLTEAIVVINGKVLKYKYNSAIDLDDPDNFELLYKQIAVADEQIEYTLGLYSSDYYYRANVYNGSDVGTALDGFYSGTLNIPGGKNSTELEIYLKYTINVRNESDTYDVKVNEIADYYDGTFTLITDPESQSRTYVQTLNGQEVNEVRDLAEVSTIKYYDSSNNEIDAGNVSWANSGTINGSDGITYNKIVTNSIGSRTLSSGQRAEIQVTFKVNKDVSTDGNSIADSIILGEKHNVVEVTSFSTYYSNTSKNKWSSPGQVAGRVDEDSAPDNVNITEYNEKNWYEDDTDSAPILTVELYGNDREVNGLVWEDAQTNTVEYSQIIGNGSYNPDEGDRKIANLTTEVVEIISIPTDRTDSNGNTVYQEYEFIWPTSQALDFLSGKTFEELTGFDSTIVTNSNGEYEFNALPAGNYKVRFVYGDKDIATGNNGYSEVYNGQDYKSTAYEVGFNNDSDNDGYTDNEWHDLSNDDLDSARVSDARDVEARRLYVASKSEMLVYDNTSIFATADDIDADHTELYGDYEASKSTSEGPIYGDGYYMYAETAKLNIEVENIYDINYTTETIASLDGVLAVDGDIDKGAVPAGNEFSYTIDNIDFGLEERSQTKLNLEKQIKEIKLTTSDGNVILDAVYDIEYELGDDDTIKSSVTLNRSLSTGYENIASLNRSKSSQGYRYIMADGTILQGATITVQYQLTVFNVGEADTANQRLKDIWTEVNSEGYDMASNTAVNNAIERLSSPYYTASSGRIWSDLSGKYQYGTYFGSIYYLGTQGTYTDDNILVESTVHQIVDYVDPDVEFIDTDNITLNQSWSTASIEDLVQYADEGLIDPRIIQIVDSETGEPIVVDESGNITTDGTTISEVTYYNYKYNTGISETAYSELVSGLNNGKYKYSVINDKLQEFITDSKNNVIMSIDNGSTEATEGANPSLVKATTPYSAENNYDNATASINLTVSRYYSSEEDSSDIDNIAEIIKVENTVGRRDIRTIAGNTSTYELKDAATGYDGTKDLYTIADEEPDTSATEVITLSPPTGLNTGLQLAMQIIAVVLVAGIILAIGIIVIKKKVLIKK